MYMQSVAQCTRLINGAKKALKHAEEDPFAYTEDEIRHLKRSLRDLYEQRKYLNSGNGFGNDQMPQQTKFNVGDLVSYKDWHESHITFTCSHYIVVCISQWEDKDTMHGVREVNILVYPSEWTSIIPRNTNGKDQKGSISSTQTRHHRRTQPKT